MISILLKQGQLIRSTTAGKENTGSIMFMGGQYYIKELPANLKDGVYNDITLSARYNSFQNSTQVDGWIGGKIEKAQTADV